ncbi:MAG: MobA/MobL family protein [Blautia sp.]|nr:MobA/MobL family protein [Blautia sp.]MCM1200320.1 MobA/MobL family protein [Bacteroides fragilis]
MFYSSCARSRKTASVSPLIDKKTGRQKVDKRNRKQWKYQTMESTDWNSQGNAQIWRRDLADTINAANEKLGLAVRWEYRSFKEQGIDREPTIHIGAIANALERKGRLDLPTVSGKHLRRISKREVRQQGRTKRREEEI